MNKYNKNYHQTTKNEIVSISPELYPNNEQIAEDDKNQYCSQTNFDSIDAPISTMNSQERQDEDEVVHN